MSNENLSTQNIVKALLVRIKFNTQIGALSVADLFELPMRFDPADKHVREIPVTLDSIAKELNALQSADRSFVDEAPLAEGLNKLRFDTVLEIIALRKEASAKANAAADVKAYKAKLTAALANKEADKFNNMSAEEIQAELDKLNAG